jgi:hypothetical protein
MMKMPIARNCAIQRPAKVRHITASSCFRALLDLEYTLWAGTIFSNQIKKKQPEGCYSRYQSLFTFIIKAKEPVQN